MLGLQGCALCFIPASFTVGRVMRRPSVSLPRALHVSVSHKAPRHCRKPGLIYMQAALPQPGPVNPRQGPVLVSWLSSPTEDSSWLSWPPRSHCPSESATKVTSGLALTSHVIESTRITLLPHPPLLPLLAFSLIQAFESSWEQ